jgi:four helix bundle protein
LAFNNITPFRRRKIIENEREYYTEQINRVFSGNKEKETAIANQLLRSGMAIGANVSEAQQAESRSDFIHKMKIAAKEASELMYWLSVCEKSDIAGFQHELISEVNQIIAILSRIIISAKKNKLT